MGEKLTTYLGFGARDGACPWVPDMQGCSQLGNYLAVCGLRQQQALTMFRRDIEVAQLSGVALGSPMQTEAADQRTNPVQRRSKQP